MDVDKRVIENQENNKNLTNQVPQNDVGDQITESQEVNNVKTQPKLYKDTSENVFIKSLKNIDSDDEDVNIKFRSRKLLDSDEEPSTEIDNIDVTNSKHLNNIKKKHKRLAIVDSESEEEIGSPTPHNKSFDEAQKKEAAIYTANNRGNFVMEDGFSSNTNKRLLKLCDSESSDEAMEREDVIVSPKHRKIPAKSVTKSRKTKEAKPKKMTAKEALMQRKEIRSESQRMTREMNVSLPYHKPKARTLQEFLERRPRFASTVPKESLNTPPSLALKMSLKQLEIVSKRLSEREKEVEEFFKSESESESEESGEETNVKVAINDKGEVNILTPIEAERITDEQRVADNNIRMTEGDITNKEIVENQKTIEESFGDLQEREDFSRSAFVENVEENIGEREIFNDVDKKKTMEENDDIKQSTEDNIGCNNTIEDCRNKEMDLVEEINSTKDSFQNSTKLVIEDSISSNFKENQPNPKSNVAILQNILLNSRSKQITDEENLPKQEEKQNFGCGIFEHFKINSNTIDSTIFPQKQESENPNMDLSNEERNTQNEEILASQLSSSDLTNADSSKELTKLLDKYSCNDLETTVEIEAKEEEKSQLTKKSVFDLIKEQFGDMRPCLTGNSSQVVDLDENVSDLMQRFVKHTTKKHHHKHNIKLDIITVLNGEVRKENVAISVDEGASIPVIEKPGERLKKLKNELESHMAEKRSRFWQERLHTKEEYDEDREFEPDDKGSILDNEDEEEFTEIEDDEDEHVLDENGEEEKKKKKQSGFIDEEAEESDDERKTKSDDDEDYEGQEDMEVDEGSIDADDEDDQSSNNEKKKKKLRRIIQNLENDSEDEEENFKLSFLNKTRSKELLDTTDTLEDHSGPTPHQRRNDYTPKKRSDTLTRSDLGFLTPVIQLTGLQSLNSGSKFSYESPVSPFRLPETSPSMSRSGPQKQLFTEDITDSQVMDDIAQLCSGRFESQTETAQLKNQMDFDEDVIQDFSEDIPLNTQECLEICSGIFTGITQPESCDKAENEGGQNPYLSSNLSQIILPSQLSKEIKSLDNKDDERLISQLLDEEEMEQFKKKFESPEHKEVSNTFGHVIFDSSDEETEISTKNIKRKRLISEDEDSDEQHTEEQPDKIDLHDNEDDEDQEIQYDSEENEIVEKPKTLKASDFFENEAELSESEWGSADEDEKGLDDLEFELGDTEKLDDEKIKRDLERIHMRRVMDDDNQEVKMLQEIYLEDGELHGAGRERQFKWRNINSVNGDEDGNAPKGDDDEVYLEDENEDEEKWRKMRYEREVFLKKLQEKSQHTLDENDLAIEANSQIFKLGYAAMRRSMSNTPSASVEKHKVGPGSPEIKTSFTLAKKKGSFLTRSEQVLARVAEFTSKTCNLSIGGPKNSKNFVFQTIQTEVKETGFVNDKKRKAADGTPASIKRLRLNTLSPAVQKKNEKNNRVKKLFSNW